MLFSDMEGSTSLLSRLGDRYGDTLDVQRSGASFGLERWGGIEMGTEGDSFFVVFEQAGTRSTRHCRHSGTCR